MTNEIIIRHYEARDRESIRKICADTADRGNPVENFFPDRLLVEDLVTSYYTDYEPTSIWVAEAKGKVVGYLTGCFDNRRFDSITGRCITPKAVVSAVLRGVLLHKETWRLFGAALRTWRKGGFSKRIPLDKFPVHMHIDIEKEFRGRDIGQSLIEKFFDQAKAGGYKGIHAVVREDNAAGRKFFERMGFSAISRHSMFLPEPGIYRESHTIVYGKQL